MIQLVPAAALVVAVGACSAPAVPPEHTLLIGVYQPNSPGSYHQLDDFAGLAGFSPRIVSYYSTFQQPFARQFAEQAAARGAEVLVQWQPRGTTSAAVAAGKQDAYIRRFAQDVHSAGRRVIISFGQEMNGNWYPWGEDGDTPANFTAAWRHIVGIFRAAAVRNVTWLWDPNVAYPGGPPLEDWYPGDGYVDWVGLDGYFAHPMDSFDNLFKKSIVQLRSFTYKPLLIAESGVTGAAGATQLEGLFSGASRAGAIGIVYFDEAQSGGALHQDWRLEDNPANMAAFRNAVYRYALRPLRLGQNA